MLKLKTMALIGASALAVSAASTVTAQAQPWHGYGYDRAAYDRRLTTAYIDRLDWRIQRAAQERLIAWPEAREMRRQLSDVRPLAWRAQTGRANGWEVRRLETTVNRMEAVVDRYAYNDRDRYRGYDRDRDRDHDHDWRR